MLIEGIASLDAAKTIVKHDQSLGEMSESNINALAALCYIANISPKESYYLLKKGRRSRNFFPMTSSADTYWMRTALKLEEVNYDWKNVKITPKNVVDTLDLNKGSKYIGICNKGFVLIINNTIEGPFKGKNVKINDIYEYRGRRKKGDLWWSMGPI